MLWKAKKANNTCLLRFKKRSGSAKIVTRWSLLLPPPGDAAEDITNSDKMAVVFHRPTQWQSSLHHSLRVWDLNSMESTGL